MRHFGNLTNLQISLLALLSYTHTFLYLNSRCLLSFSWVRVEWYTGATNSYRMGKEGQYDLRLADSALNVISPDTETEKDELCCDVQLNGESHPTKLLRYACTKTLQIISVGIGLHSAQMDKCAVRCISCMFRAVLEPKSTLGNIYGLDNWTTLGFLKAIAGELRRILLFFYFMLF